uniref:SAP domain-containing protein n=1 Tax=Caenorhabditis japonica TaxID=281687 RepID=A0A8R1DK67_CAEJA
MADEITVSGRPIGSLKVPELREELENRGLSTKGVKAVLLERLKEALSEQGKEPEVDEQNPIVAGYLARQEAALAEARKRTESETSGTDQSIQSPTKSSPTKRQTPRRGQKAAPVEVEPEPEPEDVVKDSAESSGNSNAPEEASEQKEEPVPEPVEEPEKPEKPAEVEDVAMEEPEEPAKEPVVVQKSEEEPAPHKAE